MYAPSLDVTQSVMAYSPSSSGIWSNANSTEPESSKWPVSMPSDAVPEPWSMRPSAS